MPPPAPAPPVQPQKVTVQLGALVPPLARQLVDQCLTAPLDAVDLWQRDADAITRLKLRGFLSDAVAERCRRRLSAQIAKGVTTR